MTDSAAFGARLRREREHRGVSLQDIAQETKITRGLLDDLERGDLSRWPAGIFGRAFIRSYAESIGLEPREVLTEFLRLVPLDEGLPPPPPGPDEEPRLPGWTFRSDQTGHQSTVSDTTLRLTFAEPEAGVRPRVPRWGRRFASGLVDGAILLAGATIGLVFMGPGGWLPGLTVAALTLAVLASTVLGTTPGRRLFDPFTNTRPTGPHAHERDGLRPPPAARRDSRGLL
jgi:transcriptional regulator with XRE-family HTH domain